MQNRKINNLHGYLTVYLSLILTVMISLCLTLILGVRENTRRMQIECVTDIGMNNILAEYHRELFKQYGLFFIDTSYGSDVASYEETGRHLKHYVQMNLEGDDILLSSLLYRDLLKLKVNKVGILDVSVASDEEGEVLRRQAVDVIKQKSGVSYVQEVQNWYTIVQTYKLTERDVFQEQKEARTKLESWNGTIVMDNGMKKEVQVAVPGANITSFWEAGVLSLVVDDIATLSNQSVDLNSYISERTILPGTGIPESIVFEDNWVDQLLFHEYVLCYTGRYDQQKDHSLLKYQTEYILTGKNNDLQNLKSIVYKLLALRAAANMIYLTNDAEKMKLTELAAQLLASLILLPQTAPLFQTVLVLTWAMAESLYDVTQLFHGNRIPLMKTKYSWHYSLEEILSLNGMVIQKNPKSGLCYSDYLRILLCLQKKETTTFRLMNIMEMDIRQTKGNSFFRMDGCIDSIRAVIEFAGKDKKTYTIERTYGY
ncbi:MAG TPA: DUF5702 domain-containing protein [Lachnospiraceae bacterium]|nr:DUF5702 domain-containing protein [Lachnospiraceae bacterium]